MFVSSLDDIPTSQSTLFMLNQHENPPLQESVESYLTRELKISLFNIHNTYDNAINDVDIRAETLINLINTSRSQIQDKLNEMKKKSIEQIDNEIEKLKNLNESNPEHLINKLNEIEQIASKVNTTVGYFSDNTLQPSDKSLKGYIMTQDVQFIYKCSI
jgi:hypothetical protein